MIRLILSIILISSLIGLPLLVDNDYKKIAIQEDIEDRQLRHEVDSLKRVVALQSNRLAHWKMYSNSYQYQSEVNRCQLITNR